MYVFTNIYFPFNYVMQVIRMNPLQQTGSFIAPHAGPISHDEEFLVAVSSHDDDEVSITVPQMNDTAGEKKCNI